MAVAMIFSLLVLMLIGGFILLFPISRRLGAYMEQRLEQANRGTDGTEVRQLVPPSPPSRRRFSGWRSDRSSPMRSSTRPRELPVGRCPAPI